MQSRAGTSACSASHSYADHSSFNGSSVEVVGDLASNHGNYTVR
jgi:hypothetical protein